MHNLELFIFLITGALIVIVQNSVHAKLKAIGKTKLFPNKVLVLMAILFVAFGVLWAVSSLVEHEVQAAMMGMLLFSGIGVILAIVAYRKISSQK